jgi:hypothetical protein
MGRYHISLFVFVANFVCVETSQTPSKLDRLHQLSELLHPTGVSAGGGSEWGHAGKR